jgi:membrane fusion protein (multidrug efflux system)
VSKVTGLVLKPTSLDNTLSATGTITANNEVELRSEVAGRITGIYFKEGGKVQKGQLLVKINDADLRAQLKKLEYQRKLAQSQLARDEKLLAKEGISRQEFEVSENQVSTISADMDLVRAQLAKSEIRAPFSGIIGLKSVSEGAYISPNARIASLQEIEPVKIDFSIPEKYAGRVRQGHPVRFTIQGSEEVFEGSVFAVEPKIDVSTRTIQIRAICPNKENKVLPGAFARVSLILEKTPDALMVPTEAVIPELKGQKVYVAENGKAKPVKIKTGIRNDSTVEVIDGLKAGDTVVTTGIMYLKPDAPVKVVKLR